MPSLDFWQILILILIGLLFFKDTLLRYGLLWFGFKNESEESDPAEATLEIMKQLQHHYNDETTLLLTDIRSMAKDNREVATDVKRLVEEILKYGVPCKKDN